MTRKGSEFGNLESLYEVETIFNESRKPVKAEREQAEQGAREMGYRKLFKATAAKDRKEREKIV